MIKTASTRQIIEYLEAYEKIHGIGSVDSIGSVCPGSRKVEYIFYIRDEFNSEVRVEIPSIDREELFKNKRNNGGINHDLCRIQKEN